MVRAGTIDAMRRRIEVFGGALLALALVAGPSSCACNDSKKGGTIAANPAIDGGLPASGSTECEQLKPKIAGIYRAAAKPGDQGAEQAVADNTAMILRDCQTAPSKFAACIQAAPDVATLERDCVIPLDDEGRAEGNAFTGK